MGKQFSSRTVHLFSEGSFGFYRKKKKISGNFMFNFKQLILFFLFYCVLFFVLSGFYLTYLQISNVELSNRKWSENNNMQNVNSF